MANIVYVRQKTMNGTGGALYVSREFTGNDRSLFFTATML